IGAYLDGEYGAVIDSLVAYHNWRDRGGFEPETVDGWENATDSGDVVADRLWARINGFDE
ncbi:MAG: hypothetical protein WC495_07295, partial [Patescibacteria group bacterium]